MCLNWVKMQQQYKIHTRFLYYASMETSVTKQLQQKHLIKPLKICLIIAGKF